MAGENTKETQIRTLSEEDSFFSFQQARTYILAFENNPLHRHEFVEFFYVLSGTSTHRLNGTTTMIRPGDAFLLNHSDCHQFLSSSQDFLHRDLLFRNDFFREMCDFYSPTLFSSFNEGKMERIYHISNHRISQFEFFGSRLRPNDCSPERKTSEKMLASLLLSLMMQRSSVDPEKTTVLADRLTAVLSTAENFRVPLSQLLERFDYSPEYLMRTFKKATGLTLSNYFSEQKLLLARLLLETTILPIKEIAYRSGFDDLVYFYHRYKKEFEESPNQTRTHFVEQVS